MATNAGSIYSATADENGLISISRCIDSFGEIVITNVYMEEDKYNELVGILKKCICDKVLLLDSKRTVVLQSGATIRFSGTVEKIITNPPNCYNINDNSIRFPISCALCELLISTTPKEK